MTTFNLPDRVDTLTRADIAKIERYAISYHGTPWQPGDNTGTELSLCAVLRLTDGRWASVVAGNDYTGWGCQDYRNGRLSCLALAAMTAVATLAILMAGPR